MELRGNVPRPRVWFEDVPAEVRPLLEGLTGGTERWGSSDQPIHLDDYDLVVTFGKSATLREARHLNCLSFGATDASFWRSSEQHRSRSGLALSGRTDSISVSIPDASDLPDGWTKLLERTVASQLPEGCRRRVKADPYATDES